MRASGLRATPSGHWSSRWSAARCATPSSQSFSEHWERLARRKAYLEPGTWRAYDVDGRKRLLPAFASIPLGRLGVEHGRAWMEEQAEAVDGEEIAPTTINNTLGTLVVCLNAAVEEGLIASNPALRVERLPAVHIEREYLRLHDIPLYLAACSEVYLPLAELLIGTGFASPRRWHCGWATCSWSRAAG